MDYMKDLAKPIIYYNNIYTVKLIV